MGDVCRHADRTANAAISESAAWLHHCSHDYLPAKGIHHGS